MAEQPKPSTPNQEQIRSSLGDRPLWKIVDLALYSAYPQCESLYAQEFAAVFRFIADEIQERFSPFGNKGMPTEMILPTLKQDMCESVVSDIVDWLRAEANRAETGDVE